ncbi:hypothetical protein PoB_004183000 [Plakobranchus ocellatus]|uniref:Uncharacterized protein n=1 Tax=Plakobranchus ocellatus TaxID=259542 RepID=A0AAV4B3Y0_9GAST|nr:hypothetical protein PoB_004183000 [Plakobranchus ocellatus]
MWRAIVPTGHRHSENDKKWGVGGTVDSESALRSAGILLSRARNHGGPENLRSPCCGLAIHKHNTHKQPNFVSNNRRKIKEEKIASSKNHHRKRSLKGLDESPEICSNNRELVRAIEEEEEEEEKEGTKTKRRRRRKKKGRVMAGDSI